MSLVLAWSEAWDVWFLISPLPLCKWVCLEFIVRIEAAPGHCVVGTTRQTSSAPSTMLQFLSHRLDEQFNGIPFPEVPMLHGGPAFFLPSACGSILELLSQLSSQLPPPSSFKFTRQEPGKYQFNASLM